MLLLFNKAVSYVCLSYPVTAEHICAFGLINIMFLAEIMLVHQAKAVPLYLLLHHLKGFHFLLCCAFFHSAIMIYE